MVIVTDNDRRRFEEARRHAETNGLDFLEVLARLDLFVTEKHVHNLEVAAYERLWHRLDNQSAANILRVFAGRESGTPDDMYRALLDWLEAVIRGTADKTIDGG